MQPSSWHLLPEQMRRNYPYGRSAVEVPHVRNTVLPLSHMLRQSPLQAMLRTWLGIFGTTTQLKGTLGQQTPGRERLNITYIYPVRFFNCGSARRKTNF